MPVTYDRKNDNLPDLASVLGHINTADWLFEDEDKTANKNFGLSADGKPLASVDQFPSLLMGSDGNGNVKLSANSAALDLALSQSPGPDENNGWPPFARHRHSQQSLPINTLRKGSQVDEYDVAQINGKKVETTPTKSVASNRRSVEFALSPFGSDSKRSSLYGSPANGNNINGMPKLQQSYSTNDIPTLKNGGGLNGMGSPAAVNSHAEQHLHNHNVSIGRIPPNAVPNRHSRELSSGYSGALHASAAPFGPTMTSASLNGLLASTVGSPTMSPYPTSSNAGPFYTGYGMSMLNAGMSGLSMGPPGGPQPVYNSGGMYPQQVNYPYNPYATYGPNGRMQDSQARVIQARRQQNGTCMPVSSGNVLLTSSTDSNRFMHYDLKTMPRHEIYPLCKDQHGCRFLQKKLEERNTEYLQIIFDETAPHVVELMTDPFGNYLCQKLLEFTNHEQRNTLVRNASPALVQIALNQHGTRALQKMIEFISTREQVSHHLRAFCFGLY